MSKRLDYDSIKPTEAELIFLNGLGNWSPNGFDKGHLLAWYLETAKERVNWDGIDREKVLAEADRLLEIA